MNAEAPIIQARLQSGEAGIINALRGFLATLLNERIVDALLVPCRMGDSGAIAPVLLEDPAFLERCEPLAPMMPTNTAALVGRLTVSPTGRRIGAWLRPCELRALIELTKLHQARLDDVVTIGVDCAGTYELPDYLAMKGTGAEPALSWDIDEETEEVAAGSRNQLRTACRMCESPTPIQADIRVGLFGLAVQGEILIEREKALLPNVEPLDGGTPARDEAVARLISRREAERERIFATWRENTPDTSGLLNQLAACIRCHNCMVACPICYCKECVFRTPIFDHESERYFRWAERKGALRMPADTLLFHLTRLNHMVTSCIGCGMCDSACPSHIPVATMFRAVAERVQALFDYQAGRSLEDEIPLATFREDELTDMGI